MIYAVQQGTDVYSADIHGVTVSQVAYTKRYCQDSSQDFGSYRGDLWDTVLHTCGYDILEFRHPSRGRPDTPRIALEKTSSRFGTVRRTYVPIGTITNGLRLKISVRKVSMLTMANSASVAVVFGARSVGLTLTATTSTAALVDIVPGHPDIVVRESIAI